MFGQPGITIYEIETGFLTYFIRINKSNINNYTITYRDDYGIHRPRSLQHLTDVYTTVDRVIDLIGHPPDDY
jgi:hypothetical protein